MTHKEFVEKIVRKMPSVVLHFYCGIGEKSQIYDEHNTVTDELMREYIVNRIMDGADYDLDVFNITPNTTTFRVHMLAFEDELEDGSVKIREVQVPKNMLHDIDMHDLEAIWQFGQNDFQPQQCCSMSVGDVVEYKDKLFVAASMGFREITQEQYDELLKMDRRDRHFSEIVRPKE